MYTIASRLPSIAILAAITVTIIVIILIANK